MRHHLLNAGLAVALIATAACSGKKKPLPDAPPPPAAVGTVPGGDTTGQGTTGVTDAPIGTSNTPGGVADFVAQSGSDRVLFGYDSYEIDDEGRGILGKQAEWLARYPNVRVTIEGHTDERGTREYNLALGDRRANAAKNFLAAQGVAASRITTISFGKEKPEADGSDDAAYSRNRRAVTVIASGAAR
ncbi:peptidoglycan-associated lipoprotein Pal [Glacieibacterium frigidum]|uniref:Peptidoglycan-associated lipoprotein n=1 Tax=Glacieibacterium frigidum TaxID=2593303 RepID=A0A552UGD5_9SPHN|nr:peptidoglycan-associated lipoprotein Pal [Glacieibacterium frigidum]TRW17275.1 peptidoglycan-associated lipoprotein Pal [Glacieibacterium frigidum]